MKRLFIYISLLHLSSLFAQIKTDGALRIHIVNPPESLQVTIQKIGSTIWGDPDDYYPVINCYTYYQQTEMNHYYDFVTSRDNNLSVLGYTLYRITVIKNATNYTINLDYRDDKYNPDCGSGCYSGDLFINFNNTNNKFYRNSLLTKEYLNPIMVWEELNGENEPSTDNFENLVPPRNFDLTTISNQPVLEWASSGNPISDLAVDHLEVYRSYNYGTFVKISDVAISSSDTTYTDDEIITTSPLYFIQYKMKTVNNQNVSSSYTAVEKVKGHYGTFDKPKMPFENIDSVPENYYLFKNYPNPFNSNTVIRYQLAKEGQVQLCIYNLAGAQVCELVNQAQPAGEYQLQWDGKKCYRAGSCRWDLSGPIANSEC